MYWHIYLKLDAGLSLPSSFVTSATAFMVSLVSSWKPNCVSWASLLNSEKDFKFNLQSHPYYTCIDISNSWIRLENVQCIPPGWLEHLHTGFRTGTMWTFHALFPPIQFTIGRWKDIKKKPNHVNLLKTIETSYPALPMLLYVCRLLSNSITSLFLYGFLCYVACFILAQASFIWSDHTVLRYVLVHCT